MKSNTNHSNLLVSSLKVVGPIMIPGKWAFGNRNKFKIKPFKLDVTNGTVRGYWAVPKERKDHYPVVIISHGFGANCVLSTQYILPFIRKGFMVLCYDFTNSGFGFSGMDGTKMSLLTEKQDLLDIIDHVKELPNVEKGHIILSGYSQGGIVSSLAAAEREEDISSQILYFPAYSIPDLAREGHLMTAWYDPNNIPEILHMLAFNVGRKYAEDAMTLDPYNQMCTFKKPVYIIHGKQDSIIDINYSRKAVERFPNCKLDEINGEHGFFNVGMIASAIKTIEFLALEEAGTL